MRRPSTTRVRAIALPGPAPAFASDWVVAAAAAAVFLAGLLLR